MARCKNSKPARWEDLSALVRACAPLPLTVRNRTGAYPWLISRLDHHDHSNTTSTLTSPAVLHPRPSPAVLRVLGRLDHYHWRKILLSSLILCVSASLLTIPDGARAQLTGHSSLCSRQPDKGPPRPAIHRISRAWQSTRRRQCLGPHTRCRQRSRLVRTRRSSPRPSTRTRRLQYPQRLLGPPDPKES